MNTPKPDTSGQASNATPADAGGDGAVVANTHRAPIDADSSDAGRRAGDAAPPEASLTTPLKGSPPWQTWVFVGIAVVIFFLLDVGTGTPRSPNSRSGWCGG